jgi:trigger factor
VKWPKKGLPKIDKKDTKIEKAAVDSVVDRLLQRFETSAPVDRAAKLGDRITIDFSGKDLAGADIAGTAAKGVDLNLGSNTFIPGFEQELVGKKKGDDHTFTITFPEEYHAEHLKKKPVQFTVRVHGVSEVAKPVLTDDFAKTNLQAENAAQVRERIEKAMGEERDMMERSRREKLLLDAIADTIMVDLADELIAEEARAILDDHVHRLEEQQMTLESWMEQTKKTPEQLDEELRTQGTKRLKTRLGITSLLDEKQIVLTPEELAAAIDEQLLQLPPSETKLAQELRDAASEAHQAMLWQKRVEKLLEHLLKD